MRFSAIFPLVLLTALPLVAFSEPAPASLEQQAQALAQQFIGQLKPQLKKAMMEGGPTQAVEICTTIAPGIADSLSAESGWQVNRVSLRARNASRALPDDWEAAVLKQFDQQALAGALPGELNFGETRGDHYRYMQAQGVEPLCLVCHGEQLSAPVQEVLEQYYPDDQATGYSLGQVRGAISVSRLLDCDGAAGAALCQQGGQPNAGPGQAQRQ